MSYPKTAYTQLRVKTILDLLDKFPQASSRTLARIAYRDNHPLFKDEEDARGIIRYFRGASGGVNRNKLKNKKYVREQK
jgi:hypothetical protein